MEIDKVLFIFISMCLLSNIALSIYGILFRPSLIKKLIALIVLGDSANILAILIGFRVIAPYPRPPIVRSEDIEAYVAPSSLSVDPVPQALVLTAIVIGLAIYLVIASLILRVYMLYGTTDVRKIARLRG